MADNIRTTRLFFEALDKSGLSDQERLDRIQKMAKFIEPYLLAAMYDSKGIHGGEYSGQRYPKKAAPKAVSGIPIEHNGSIPIQSLTEIIILIYSYLYRYQNLKRLKWNQRYFAETQPPYLPVFIERYAHSMDVENWFNLFNYIMGNLGKYNEGKGTMKDAIIGMKKLIYANQCDFQVRNYKTSSMYSGPLFSKSKDDILKWNNGDGTSVSRGEKRGTLTRVFNSEKDTLLPSRPNALTRTHYR